MFREFKPSEASFVFIFGSLMLRSDNGVLVTLVNGQLQKWRRKSYASEKPHFHYFAFSMWTLLPFNKLPFFNLTLVCLFISPDPLWFRGYNMALSWTNCLNVRIFTSPYALEVHFFCFLDLFSYSLSRVQDHMSRLNSPDTLWLKIETLSIMLSLRHQGF